LESEHPEKIKFRILCASTVSRGKAVLQRAVRAGQVAAGALGKEIEFEVNAPDLPLDEPVWHVIADPLLHLIRNAVDHGIEHSGKIIISVKVFSNELQIQVTDDGRGIDPQTIGQLFQPGFSTASQVSEISGRGVGLDVVKTTVEARGGSMKIQ